MPSTSATTPETCPFGACDGTGFVVDEDTNTAADCRCRAQRVSNARARSLSGVLPRKYRGVSFDRPPVTEIDAGRVGVVRRYANRIDEQLDAGRGLWLYGSVGTGKTTLAMLVSKHALEAGRSVAIYSLPDLLVRIRATFNDDRSNSYLDLIDRLTKVDLLQVDDVGAENTSPWVLEQLYALVNARYEDERSIVITTNLEKRDELAEQIGDRTVSRLVEMCDVLPLCGTDQRQEVAARRALGA